MTLYRVGSLLVKDRRELCLIKNISAGGMMIRAYCAIAPGTRLSVELKCGESVDGKALWIKGETVGVEFDKPVDVVELLASTMEGPRPRMPRIAVDCVVWIREGAGVYRVHARDVSQGGVGHTAIELGLVPAGPREYDVVEPLERGAFRERAFVFTNHAGEERLRELRGGGGELGV